MTRTEISALRICILEMHEETCQEGGQAFQRSSACKTALAIIDAQVASDLPPLDRAYPTQSRDAVA